MKLILLLAIAFASISSALYGQSTTKCDMTNFLDISKNLGHLSHQQVSDFLLTFGEECKNNVEYSEWSNELLFELLDKQTEMTVKTIAHERKRIELAAILDNLQAPIHDKIEVKTILAKVEKVN